MKKLYFVILLILFSSLLYSQDKGSGIGIMLGEPSGISLKQWFSSETAVDVGIAYSLVQTSSMLIQLDYVIHNYNLISVSKGKLSLYYGIGGRMKFKDDDNSGGSTIGLRIPVGLDYQFSSDPVDVFVEIVPVIDFAHVTKLNFSGSLGLRYFFN